MAAALRAALQHEANQKSWLLVRDGRQVFLVTSPVESHEAAAMLFPEQDIDGSVFGGIDGAQVTPEDLRWTDKLSELHKIAVHYRRFAVMLAGLIAREVFFKGVDFNDLFHARKSDSLFCLVRDASGEGVLADGREGLQAYLKRVNQGIRPGARVLVNWAELSCHGEIVPAAWTGSGDRVYRAWNPTQALAIATAAADGRDLVVSGEFEKWGSRSKRVRGYLVKDGIVMVKDSDVLCVDRLDAETLDRLMSIRSERRRYYEYMPLLRRARDEALAVMKQDQAIVAHIADALVAASLAKNEEAVAAAKETLAAWRAEFGAPPAISDPDFQKVLDRVFRLTRAGAADIAAIEKVCADNNVKPLRLALEADGRLILFAEPRDPDHRGARQVEVDRWVVKQSKGGYKLDAPILAPMFKIDAGLTAVHQWPGVEHWELIAPPSLRVRRKKDLLEDIETHFERRRQMMMGPIEEQHGQVALDEYASVMDKLMRGVSKQVPNPGLVMPFGLVETKNEVFVLAFWRPYAVMSLARHLPSDLVPHLRAMYVGYCRSKHAALEQFNEFRKGKVSARDRLPTLIATPARDFTAGALITDFGRLGGGYLRRGFAKGNFLETEALTLHHFGLALRPLPAMKRHKHDDGDVRPEPFSLMVIQGLSFSRDDYVQRCWLPKTIQGSEPGVLVTALLTSHAMEPASPASVDSSPGPSD